MARWKILLVSLGIAGGATSACAQIIGLEPYPSGGGGSGQSAGGAGGTAGSSTQVGGGKTSSGTDGHCAGSCAPKAPGDWKGPAAYSFGSVDSVSCSGGAPLTQGYAGATAGNCTGCGCNASAGCAMTYELCTSAGCPDSVPGNCTTTTMTSGPCRDSEDAAQSLKVIGFASSGSCEVTGSPHVPELSFESFALGCALPAVDGACVNGDACLGDPPHDFRICIYRGHDGTDCPAEYPEHHAYFETTKVSCGACSCDALTTADCAPSSVVFHNAGNCMDAGTVPDGKNCTPVMSIIKRVEYVPSGTCAPHSASTVTNTDAIDVCCL